MGHADTTSLRASRCFERSPRIRGGLVVVVTAVLVSVFAPVPNGASAFPVVSISNYTGTGIGGPRGMTAGPDGNLWFTNFANNSVGRITPAGVVTNFKVPGISNPWGITAGPDGNLWFASTGNDSLGRLTPLGALTVFTDPKISYPTEIAAGPDGNLWFTSPGNNAVERITPAGIVTKYTGNGIASPYGITAGPDGNLWFTNTGNGSVGRITPGGIVTNFTSSSIAGPYGIAAGPDGNVWFTNTGTGSVGRITPAGTVTKYTSPTIASPYEITAGSDGNLWFTNAGNNSVGRITPSGIVTNETSPTIAGPYGIAAGPDGNVWFTNSANNSVGRVGVPPRFSDVPFGAPFFADIMWMASKGITTGYPDGTFHPGEPVPRQAMAAFLYRLEGSPFGADPLCFAAPYSDVAPAAPFCGEISWMKSQLITTGYPDGSFHPAEAVPRQAMAAFLYRFKGSPNGAHPTCAIAPFTDVAPAAPFCGEIKWLKAKGIATGNADGSFSPNAPITRQAMAAFLHRLSLLA